jgi:hypothetical protein
MRTRLLLASSMLLASTPALAGRLQITAAEASSTYTGEGSYTAAKVHDGKQGTAWVEGDEGSGMGAWIKIDLSGEQSVTGLRIWGGDWYDSNSWERANRPRELEVAFSDGTKQTVALEDKMVAQTFSLDKPTRTDSVRVRIKSVYAGSTWLDTGISEIQVLDGVDAGPAVTASSVLPADGDGNYEPSNLLDGLADSMWCEADKAGDGTGQSITFDFGSTRKLAKFDVINGIGTSFVLWAKANRATRAKLTFSNGSSVEVDLKDSSRPQTVTFPPVDTSKVTVTFLGVVAGKEYNDLCISELHFGG